MNNSVRPTFELTADDLTLNHIHDEDDDEDAGYYMHVTQPQSDAILQAIEAEQKELAVITGSAVQPRRVKQSVNGTPTNARRRVHNVHPAPVRGERWREWFQT